MSPPSINFLRFYRKKTALSQSDLAFLTGHPDTTAISRYEKGQREPGIDLLLVYHLVFNIPIESFFEYRRADLFPKLKERAELLLDDLHKQEVDSRTVARILFLEELLTRLTK